MLNLKPMPKLSLTIIDITTLIPKLNINTAMIALINVLIT